MQEKFGQFGKMLYLCTLFRVKSTINNLLLTGQGFVKSGVH